jgi:DNA polymerase-3 subunit delta'
MADGAAGHLETGGSSGAVWPIWGHETAVASLALAIREGRVGHAYLMAGPSGIGKATLAQVFAQALCCDATDRPDPGIPCGMCRSCRKISRGTHPDVRTWSLATQAATQKDGKHTTLNIETAREIRAATALRPVEAPRRVIVVDDAETMQGAAQEALLKTLEEPPPAVVLLMLADDAELLMPTIRSRCLAVDLRPVSAGAIARGLVNHGIDPTLAAEVAALAHGRPGWALAAAANPAMLTGEREAVAGALAWIAGTRYDRLATAFKLGDGFSKRRAEIFTELEIALAVWRDVLLAHCGLASHLTYRREVERIVRLAESLDLASIAHAVAATQRCLADLDANVRPRLALEGMVLQWPSP